MASDLHDGFCVFVSLSYSSSSIASSSPCTNLTNSSAPTSSPRRPRTSAPSAPVREKKKRERRVLATDRRSCLFFSFLSASLFSCSPSAAFFFPPLIPVGNTHNINNTGEKGIGKSGKPLHFKGSTFHRVITECVFSIDIFFSLPNASLCVSVLARSPCLSLSLQPPSRPNAHALISENKIKKTQFE